MTKHQFLILTSLVTGFFVVNFIHRSLYFKSIEMTSMKIEQKQDNILPGMNLKKLLPEKVFSSFISKYITSSNEKVDKGKFVEISELYMSLSDISKAYLQKKQKNVSKEELQYWKQAIFTKIELENFWSDVHKKAEKWDGSVYMHIDDKLAWSIVKKFIDGMEEFHAAWEIAATSKCIEGDLEEGDELVAKTRAAYSAYDAGMAEVCRWKNNKSTKASRDSSFFSAFKSSFWKNEKIKFSLLPARKSSSPKKVLIKKREVASVSMNIPSEGSFVELPDQKICIVHNRQLNCLAKTQDIVCLLPEATKEVTLPTKLSWKEVNSIRKKTLDRYKVCEKFNPSLRPISSMLRTKKNIRLRKSPGGNVLVTVPAGSKLKIKDFYIESAEKKHTYYQVSYKGRLGYIYAGNRETNQKWITSVKKKTPKHSEITKVVRKFKNFLSL